MGECSGKKKKKKGTKVHISNSKFKMMMIRVIVWKIISTVFTYPKSAHSFVVIIKRKLNYFPWDIRYIYPVPTSITHAGRRPIILISYFKTARTDEVTSRQWAYKCNRTKTTPRSQSHELIYDKSTGLHRHALIQTSDSRQASRHLLCIVHSTNKIFRYVRTALHNIFRLINSETNKKIFITINYDKSSLLNFYLEKAKKKKKKENTFE